MLLDRICNELNIKVGETWLGNNGLNYMIDVDGYLFIVWEDETEPFYENGTEYMPELLTGELRPVWRPKKNESYYYACIDLKQGYAFSTWENDVQDIHRFANNLVFKTKEEAIEMTYKILDMLEDEGDSY